MATKANSGITKTAPRISNKSADWHKQTFSSVNAGLEYILDATPQLYRLTLHALKGRFSRGELMLIIDALSGTMLTAGLAGQHLAIDVSDAIALDHLDTKWSVDGDALKTKIAALTIYEASCLELWAQAVRGKKLDAYVDALVGSRS